jgi:hypothetical protein
MAFNDIWVDTDALGGYTRIMEGHMTAGQTFFKGEPVTLAAAGTWEECATDPAVAAFGGIAANGPGDGVAPYGMTAVGGFGATNLKVKVVVPNSMTFFLTQNFSTTTVFNNVPPTVSMIGDTVALLLTSGVWGLRQAGGTDLICTITDVLDTNFKSYRFRTDVPSQTASPLIGFSSSSSTISSSRKPTD